MFSKLISVWKAEWLQKNVKSLLSEHQTELSSLLESQASDLKALEDKHILNVARIQEDLDFQEQRLSDRRLELLKASDDLKTQIRLLEAKASPDQVWASAFSTGFSKALEMLPELSSETKKRLTDSIRDDILDNLSSLVDKRARELYGPQLQKNK